MNVKCPKCGESDPAKFAKNRYRSTGLQIYCKDCHRPIQNASVRKYRYKISNTEYEALKTEQKGLCALCSKPPFPGKRGGLMVDHDHKTNMVRGLVHHKCNLLLGFADDNPELLQAALNYLAKR